MSSPAKFRPGSLVRVIEDEWNPADWLILGEDEDLTLSNGTIMPVTRAFSATGGRTLLPRDFVRDRFRSGTYKLEIP